MNQRKLNISTWYSLGLAAVLVVFSLLVAIGTTWARYRTEKSEEIYFEPADLVEVCLGKVEYEEGNPAAGKFVQSNEGSWELNEEGQLQLKFAVANGTSVTAYERQSQEFYIRLVGSLGIQSEEKKLSLKLTFPDADEPEGLKTVEATAIRIVPGSAMYNTFGDGWVFSFMDEEEGELTWMLEGGSLSYIEMALTLENGTLADASLLQLQIASRHIKE